MKNPSSHLRFSSAILILIVLGITSLRFSMLPEKNVTHTPLDHATALIKDIRVHKALTWRLIATHDPYQGESFLRTNPTNAIKLHLDHEGTFREVRKDKIVQGRWKLDSGGQHIKMLCERINGRPVKKSRALSNYILISYSANFLVLGKPGRHGVFEMKFQRLTSTQRSSGSDLF